MKNNENQMFSKEDLQEIYRQRAKWDWDFVKDYYIEPEQRLSFAEIDNLVKLYKESTNEKEKREIEEEIFHQNFYILYYQALKNTYVSDYNKDDVIGVIYLVHKYLLDSFKFNYEKENGFQILTISFRFYLKKYFPTKFHRFFVENSGSCSSLSNYKDRNTQFYSISTDDEIVQNSLFNEKNLQEYDSIERSDVNVKEKVKSIVCNCKYLNKNQQSAILKTFGFVRIGRDKRNTEEIALDCKNGIEILKKYHEEELKMLLDYIKLLEGDVK